MYGVCGEAIFVSGLAEGLVEVERVQGANSKVILKIESLHDDWVAILIYLAASIIVIILQPIPVSLRLFLRLVQEVFLKFFRINSRMWTRHKSYGRWAAHHLLYHSLSRYVLLYYLRAVFEEAVEVRRRVLDQLAYLFDGHVFLRFGIAD